MQLLKSISELLLDDGDNELGVDVDVGDDVVDDDGDDDNNGSSMFSILNPRWLLSNAKQLKFVEFRKWFGENIGSFSSSSINSSKLFKLIIGCESFVNTSGNWNEIKKK